MKSLLERAIVYFSSYYKRIFYDSKLEDRESYHRFCPAGGGKGGTPPPDEVVDKPTEFEAKADAMSPMDSADLALRHALFLADSVRGGALELDRLLSGGRRLTLSDRRIS